MKVAKQNSTCMWVFNPPTRFPFASLQACQIDKRKGSRSVKVKGQLFRQGIILRFPAVQCLAGADSGTTLVINGNVYTLSKQQPLAEAIAVQGQHIVFVGATGDARKM